MDRKTNLAILKKELTELHPDVRKQKLAIEETRGVSEICDENPHAGGGIRDARNS